MYVSISVYVSTSLYVSTSFCVSTSVYVSTGMYVSTNIYLLLFFVLWYMTFDAVVHMNEFQMSWVTVTNLKQSKSCVTVMNSKQSKSFKSNGATTF